MSERAFLRVSMYIWALVGACTFSTIVRAQQAPANLPQFETVSIRPADPDGPANYYFMQDGFIAKNVQLGQLILQTYGLEQPYQIIGLPKWAQSAHYAIVAKVGESDMPAMKRLRYSQQAKMVQPILEDRFSLRCHWEKRSLPAYTLQVSTKGTRLKDITSADNSKMVMVDGNKYGTGLTKTVDGQVIAREVPIGMLASELSADLDTKVIDNTGLTGKYDFEIQLPRIQGHSPSPGADDDPSDPDSTSDLIQEGLSQIGLKLIRTKAELPVLIIDDLKPPSPN